MTPPTPSSGDSPLPKKHRPPLGQLSTETTEGDLWDFEEELDELREGGAPAAREAADSVETPPAESAGPKKTEIPQAKNQHGAGDENEPPDLVRVNVNRPKPKSRRGIPNQDRHSPENVFDDLDQWDEAASDGGKPDEPAPDRSTVDEEKPPVGTTPAAEPTDSGPVETPEPKVVSEGETPEDLDEFNPHTPSGAAPVSLQPKLSLSGLERMGLIALAVAMAAAAGLAYWFSISRIRSESDTLTERDFPIRGKLITANSARTYWRAPVAGGPEADTVRRGTKLIPVIELDLDTRSAVLRVVFHDDTGAAIGDITTTEVRTGTTTIAATAGFDELGMHAAYRTGGVEPWTVEVLEGSPGATRGDEFSPLFEIDISALRR